MDLGSEISRTFKDSIKQKLKECGTYIDDELPEYIMVMIANKRHENQMKEDLSLFLGDKTDNFVGWLFQMLTDLQNVAQNKLKAGQPERSKLQAVETSEAQNTQKTRDQSRREANNKEANELAILTRQIPDEIKEKIKMKEACEADMLDTGSDHDNEGKSNIGRKKRDVTESRKRRNLEGQSEKIEKSNKTELSSREQSKRSKQSWSSMPKQKEDNLNDKEEESNTPRRIASSVVVQKIRPSLPRSHQPTGSLVMRAINEANLSVSMKPRRSQDQVEVVTGRPDDAVERKIQLKRNRSSMQGDTAGERGNDEIGERGTESNDVEAPSKRQLSGDQEKAQDDDIELEVGENEFIDEGDEVAHKASKRIVISHGGIEGGSLHVDKDASQTIHDNEKENMERGRKRDESDNGCYGRDVRGGEKNEEDEEEDEIAHSNRKKRKHKRERSNHRERRYNNPKFIVTLHGGLDERVKEERLQHQQQQPRHLERDPLFINLNPKGPMAVLESAQNEINRMARQLDLIQNIVPYSDASMPVLPSQSTTIVTPRSGIISSITRPVFQETLPLMPMSNGVVQQNDFVAQQSRIGLLQTPFPVTVTQAVSGNKENPVTRTQSREIVVPLETENGSENDETEEAENLLQTEKNQEKVLERCKFWPSCKNPSCPYVHPSKTCRMFPNCSYKDKCIFLHPLCKFDQRCINSECPFTHTSNQKREFSNFESKAIAIPPFRKNSINTPLCKFIPNCSKSNCPFRHPVAKPCRYGSGCKRPNCQFHHETKPATGDALKWTNSSSNNIQKHISERKFAVRDKDVTEVPVEIKSKAN